MSDEEDEAMILFGEDEGEPETEAVEYTVQQSIMEVGPEIDAPTESRIIKFPLSALSVDFEHPDHRREKVKSSAHLIQCRETSSGDKESNTRLVEWEDGSWTLIVGREEFRVLERKEEVEIFEKEKSSAALYISAGSVDKQFNVIPGSLESRAHRNVVEKSAVTRRLNEARKVTLAHGLATSSSSSLITVSSKNLIVENSTLRKKELKQQALTAEFLEAGLGGGIKQIKAQYKRGAKVAKRKAIIQEEEEDVRFEESDNDDSSDSSSSPSSSSSSSSGESSSSD